VPSNPDGQLRSAEIIADGPLLPIRPLHEQDIENQLSSNSLEIFDENDSLFALFLGRWELSIKGIYGLVLNKVSAETYRRVGLISLTASNSIMPDFSKKERVRIT
jgi:hypothetical protein